MKNKPAPFLDDKEKMRDFFRMDKPAFLASYSYLTEEEYDATKEAIENMPVEEYEKRFLPRIFPGFPVSVKETPELIGQIIDTFEDFLDEKGVVIPNEDRDNDPNLEPEESANIYGEDYDIIADGIREILSRWKITKE